MSLMRKGILLIPPVYRKRLWLTSSALGCVLLALSALAEDAPKPGGTDVLPYPFIEGQELLPQELEVPTPEPLNPASRVSIGTIAPPTPAAPDAQIIREAAEELKQEQAPVTAKRLPPAQKVAPTPASTDFTEDTAITPEQLEELLNSIDTRTKGDLKAPEAVGAVPPAKPVTPPPAPPAPMVPPPPPPKVVAEKPVPAKPAPPSLPHHVPVATTDQPDTPKSSTPVMPVEPPVREYHGMPVAAEKPTAEPKEVVIPALPAPAVAEKKPEKVEEKAPVAAAVPAPAPVAEKKAEAEKKTEVEKKQAEVPPAPKPEAPKVNAKAEKPITPEDKFPVEAAPVVEVKAEPVEVIPASALPDPSKTLVAPAPTPPVTKAEAPKKVPKKSGSAIEDIFHAVAEVPEPEKPALEVPPLAKEGPLPAMPAPAPEVAKAPEPAPAPAAMAEPEKPATSKAIVLDVTPPPAPRLSPELKEELKHKQKESLAVAPAIAPPPAEAPAVSTEPLKIEKAAAPEVPVPPAPTPVVVKEQPKPAPEKMAEKAVEPEVKKEAPAVGVKKEASAEKAPEKAVEKKATKPVEIEETARSASGKGFSIEVTPPPSSHGISKHSSLSEKTREILNALPSDIGTEEAGAKEPINIDHSDPNAGVLPGGEDEANEMGITISQPTGKLSSAEYMDQAYKALMAGQEESAVALYKKVLAQDESNRFALFGIATTYHRNGQLGKARDYYQKLLSLYPRDEEALNNFLVLVSQESPEDALIELKTLAQRNPDFSPIQAQLAYIYSKMGNDLKAAKYLTEAVKLSPDDLTYRYNLAILMDKMGYYKRAVSLYEQIIQEADHGGRFSGSLDGIQKRLTFLRSKSG